MRVRTIIDLLDCQSFCVLDDKLLDRDVVVCAEESRPSEHLDCMAWLVEYDSVVAMQERIAQKDVLFAYVDGESHAVSDELKCPFANVVLVWSSQSFEELGNVFTGLLQSCAILSLRRAQLHEAFLHSYDIRQFAQRACDAIGNPLIVTNSDHRLLACAGQIPEGRDDVCEVIELGYVTDSVNTELEHDGVIHDVRLRRHAVLTENPRFGQRWAHSIVYAHHMELGRFDVLESSRPITPIDLELIDYASSLAGVMIERLGVAGDRAGAGSSVLRDLINGSFVNEKTMRAQMALTRLPLGESYVMLAVVGQQGAGSDYYVRAARMVSDTLRKCLWSIEGNVLAVLVPIGKSTCVGYDDYQRARRLLMLNRRLRAVLNNNDMYAFVSEPFSELNMGAGRFGQCIELMDAVGDERLGRIRLFWEDRFKVLACSAKTFEQMDSMLDKRVIAMMLYDQEHDTQYFETAVMSVRHPGSPAEAAEALNVHRNTYFYRINKARELFYLDLKDGDDRISLAFTALILEGLGNRFHVDLRDYPHEQ